MDPALIPERLRDGLFVKVGSGKRAFESFDVKTKQYVYDYNDPIFQDWLKKNRAYGIVAGYTRAIIDADIPELVSHIRQNLPLTYEVFTPGHGGIQFHYDCQNSGKTIPLTDKTRPKKEQNVGHVKLGNGYGLGPGSLHPNGQPYRPAADRLRATITEDDIHRVLGQWIVQRAATVEKAEARKHHAPDSFSILDLVNSLGLNDHGNGELQGSHPKHGSTGGSNFCVNTRDNVWHCFRCETGGGPYQLLAVLEGIIECEDSVPGGLRGELFKRTRDIALAKGLIKKPALVSTETDDKPQLTEDAEPAEVAEAILAILRVHSLFKGEMYIYDKGVYRHGGEAAIRRIVEANFHRAGVGERTSNHFVNEVLGHVQRRTYVEADIFDADPKILNLENGLLNVETGELQPHSPDDPSLSKLPVTYDPTAKCPHWERFQTQIHHAEDIMAVQEYCGSFLVKHYKTQKAWMKVGEGENGKDTENRVLIAILGPENVSNHSLQALEENRFAVASLFGKLANICSDLSDRALKATGTFKNITGEGRITTEKKFQDAFDFVNHAKLVFNANKIPQSPDDTDAFFRRWFITVYPNIFRGEKRDPNLVAKLTTPGEKSGILNWMLIGLKRLREQNWHLSNSKSVEEIREDYVRKSDPVKAFVMDCCIADLEGSISKQRLFQAFVRYCTLKKLPPVLSDTFFKRLPMAGVPINTAKRGPKGKQVPSFTGLWLRRPENWSKEPVDDEKPLLDNETLSWTLDSNAPDTPATPDTNAPSDESVSGVSTVSEASPPAGQLDSSQFNTSQSHSADYRQNYFCEVCGKPATPITRVGESQVRAFCSGHLGSYKGDL